MKNSVIGTVLGLAIASACLPASAQFGALGGALGGGGGSVTADSLVKSYVAGTQLVMSSDVSLLKALNLKEQADKEELAAKNLTQGATTASLEDAEKVRTESSKALGESMEGKKVVMSAQAKKDYVRGVVDLAKGIKAYTAMGGDVKNFKPSVASLGSGATAALFVVKTLPSSLSGLKDTLTRSIAFAKENKIELPADATSVL